MITKKSKIAVRKKEKMLDEMQKPTINFCSVQLLKTRYYFRSQITLKTASHVVLSGYGYPLCLVFALYVFHPFIPSLLFFQILKFIST